jgi:hypothetical protein
VEEILGRKKPGGTTHSFIESLNFYDAHIFPSVFTTIKIAACIPVTVVPVERSFSTMNRLKTYLRNAMG